MLPAEDNGSHMYELEVSQRLKPQGGNATILPPEMRLTQADFNFLIQTQKNIKVSMGVVRTTYLIDENGIIIRANDKVKAAEDAEKMLGELE